MKEKSKNRDLFVTDIDFTAEEEDLRKLFSVCGTVKNIHLITDPKSGTFRGCAFVNMSTAAEAKEAINLLDGTLLLERCIGVQEARPKGAASTTGAAREPSPKGKRPRGRRR